MQPTRTGRHVNHADHHRHLSSHRCTLVTTRCLKCATRQLQGLIQLPRVQVDKSHIVSSEPGDKMQPLQQHAPLLSQFSMLHQQQKQHGMWQLASADVSSSISRVDVLYMRQCSDSQQSNAAGRANLIYDAQQLMQYNARSASGPSSSNSGSSSSSRDAGMPLMADMPSLESLLGDADGHAGSPAVPSCQQAEAKQAESVPCDDRWQASQQQREQQQPQAEVSPGVKVALAMLKWYKDALSPMMASTCRFLPTCSSYSMDSYRTYGVAKGTVLTAWRLLRCNPWGPSGYDPTTWPPPGLGGMFKFEGSAEIAVLVGTAAVLRFAHALLFE